MACRAYGCISIVTLCVVLATSPTAAADPFKVGGEILVSDYGPEPVVAADPAGNFLVVWDVFRKPLEGRAFWSSGYPQGPVFPLSASGFIPDGVDSSGNEIFDVAADAAGNFVVAYSAKAQTPGAACFEKPCILTRRRDANGNVSAASFVVGDPRLLSYGRDYNLTESPRLASDGEGNFVVAWEGYDLNPAGYVGDEGVWARKLVSSGQVNGGQFRVNEHTEGYQGDESNLDVAADGQGNFVVVWADDYADLPPYGGVVFRRFDKAKNPIGVQTQVTAEFAANPPPRIAQTPDGEFIVVWQSQSLFGRVFDREGVPEGPAFVISSDGRYPQVAASKAGSFIVVFEVPGGAAGMTFDSTGAPTSSQFPLNTLPGALDPSVAADQDGNFVVAWWRFGDFSAHAQRFQVAAPTPVEIQLLGRVAVITNKAPDDFEKSGGKWTASGPEIVAPLRGSSSDPRCNAHPPGTVKATVRFLSATSGEDVTIELPCQNWSVTGSNKATAIEKRGYKYSDSKREDGPCTSVKLKGTKRLSVSCKGKPGAASFDYDLQPGASQGAVTATLELGLFKYCAEFEPVLDGSDGKKYKGKSIMVPVSCPPALHPTPTPIPSPTPSPTPSPAPPSGAFVDGPVGF